MHKAVLNAWNRIQELGKRTKSYTKVKKGQREPFSDFLQILSKAVQIGETDPDAKGVLIEPLAFEDASLECKKILGPLKVRSVPMDEWILHTMNVQTFVDNANPE